MQAFSQSLESWKQKNIQGHHTSSCPQFIQTTASSLYDVLSTEELERYKEVAASVGPLIKWSVNKKKICFVYTTIMVGKSFLLNFNSAINFVQ